VKTLVLHGSEANGTGSLEFIGCEVSDGRKEAREPLLSNGFHQVSSGRNDTSGLGLLFSFVVSQCDFEILMHDFDLNLASGLDLYGADVVD